MSEKCGLEGQHEPTYRSYPDGIRTTCNCAESRIAKLEKALKAISRNGEHTYMEPTGTLHAESCIPCYAKKALDEVKA